MSDLPSGARHRHDLPLDLIITPLPTHLCSAHVQAQHDASVVQRLCRVQAHPDAVQGAAAALDGPRADMDGPQRRQGPEPQRAQRAHPVERAQAHLPLQGVLRRLGGPRQERALLRHDPAVDPGADQRGAEQHPGQHASRQQAAAPKHRPEEDEHADGALEEPQARLSPAGVLCLLRTGADGSGPPSGRRARPLRLADARPGSEAVRGCSLEFRSLKISNPFSIQDLSIRKTCTCPPNHLRGTSSSG